MSFALRRVENSELESSSRLESLVEVPVEPAVSLLVVQLASEILGAFAVEIVSILEFKGVSRSSLRAFVIGAAGSWPLFREPSLITSFCAPATGVESTDEESEASVLPLAACAYEKVAAGILSDNWCIVGITVT